MINNFISKVKSEGLARLNRYKVVIPFPTGSGIDMQDAMLLCDAVQLPGYNIATQPARIYGESREMPYERNYGPVNLSFYMDSSLAIRQLFEEWMEIIVNPQTRTIGYYKDYVRRIDIYVDNVNGTVPYVLSLHEAYPKSIGDVQMDANSKDIMRLPVTIQYKYWTSKFNYVDTGAGLPVGSATPMQSMTGTANNTGANTWDDLATEEDIIAVEDDPGRDFGMNNDSQIKLANWT